MKRTVDFNGKIPGALAGKLQTFVENANVGLSADRQGAKYSNFFIIAPPQMFKGYKHPGKVFKEGMAIASEAQKEAFDKLKPVYDDPILVYGIDKDNYALVESWGNDSTSLRRFYGRMTDKSILSGIVNTLSFLVAWFIAFVGYKVIALMDAHHQLTMTHKPNEGCLWEIGMVLIGMATIIGIAVWFFSAYFKTLRKHIKDQNSENIMKTKSEFVP
jgi:hypothetical protein